MEEMSRKRMSLEELERRAVAAALVEERMRYCMLVGCLKPVAVSRTLSLCLLESTTAPSIIFTKSLTINGILVKTFIFIFLNVENIHFYFLNVANPLWRVLLWRFGVAVTTLGVSTKYCTLSPVSTGMGDRLRASVPPRSVTSH